MVQIIFPNGTFLVITVLIAGPMIALSILRTTVLDIRGIGEQVFTLFAPGFPLLLQVCPRLRVMFEQQHPVLPVSVNNENLLFLRHLLTMIPGPLVVHPFRRSTLPSVLRVLATATVIMMFPLVVRLLVPTMTGILPVLIQVIVVLQLLNALQVVAGTLHPPTRLPVNRPEYLKLVVPPSGLKIPRLVVLNVLAIFLNKGTLGLMKA